MPRDGSASDPIFQPLKFRNLEIANRVLRSNISGRFDNDDGSLTEVRVNWELRFARGGVGAIVSSYVPVLLEGRIMPGYATLHRDDFVPAWRTLANAVHAHGTKYIVQLSHSGRQVDFPGIHNQHQVPLSATGRTDWLHGFRCRAMSADDIADVVQAFAQAARRAREAGIDGIELHAANGYLFTQFLSSAINDRKDRYGGALANRARFLLEVIAAIRAEVGRDYHLQVKLSAADHADLFPWRPAGNTLADTIEVAKWCEVAGVDALHISTGSFFPHPLNPPGPFPLETLVSTYDGMISSGAHGLRNYIVFRTPLLRDGFRALWSRFRRNRPDEGVTLDDAGAIKQAVSIPVISTGGYQSASVVRQAIQSGAVDAVSIARALVANNDLVRIWQSGADRPERPCTYCNKCLASVLKHPLGCYEEARFADREAMLAEIMSTYHRAVEANGAAAMTNACSQEAVVIPLDRMASGASPR